MASLVNNEMYDECDNIQRKIDDINTQLELLNTYSLQYKEDNVKTILPINKEEEEFNKEKALQRLATIDKEILR